MSSISIPAFSLVLLIGSSDTDRSTFARSHFSDVEILSLDIFVDGLGGGKEEEVKADAAEALAFLAEKRLKHKQLTVVDAENLSQKARKAFRLLSRKFHCPLVGLGFGYGSQEARFFEEVKLLSSEGFVQHHVFHSSEEANAAKLTRLPLDCDAKAETGPFDVVGDLHGCAEELKMLLGELGYEQENGKWGHANGRRLIFVGDLVNKGPDSAATLRLVMDLVEQNLAFCVPGNHDEKLLRALKGNPTEEDAPLQESLSQIEAAGPEFSKETIQFLEALPAHLELDGGKLVVAHAGLKREMHGRSTSDVRAFCLWGETSSEMDEFGLPVRFNWAEEYAGQALVVYGHTPVPSPIWQGNTVNIDTGCVYGGALTALRYPEGKTVSIPATQVHSEPRRPLALQEETGSSASQDILEISRFSGRNLCSTRFNYHVTLKEEYAPAVLEALSMSRIDPHWFIFLPSSFSPPKSSKLPGLLEHPIDAINYYRKKGMEKVILHDAGLGNRSVLVVCKDAEVARNRFGVRDGSVGAVYDRFGQPCFERASEEAVFVGRMREAVSEAELWAELETDWLCIEGEITPWNGGLGNCDLYFQEDIVVAGGAVLEKTLSLLDQAGRRGLNVDRLRQAFGHKRDRLQAHASAQNAAFKGERGFWMWHLLASEGETYSAMSHAWHLGKLASMAVSGLCQTPAHRIVDVNDEAEVREAGQFWQSRTQGSQAGMLVKPEMLMQEGGADLIQPGLKVRGKQMLRGIYGPEYDDPRYLDGYRSRSLKDKRMMVVRQFALGWEGLNRFVEERPFLDVYECFSTGMSLNAFDLDQRI